MSERRHFSERYCCCNPAPLGTEMDESTELQSLAAKCRQLAKANSDGPARNSLNDLAAEYEQRAADGAASDPPGEAPAPSTEPEG